MFRRTPDPYKNDGTGTVATSSMVTSSGRTAQAWNPTLWH
jgi:hypothetical protein